MNVLSLFDGVSCGQVALNRLGIQYDNYFSSEIDKFAIKVTQHHFPKTIQLGDVQQIDSKTLPPIDLLMGGSPCQGFSYAGKNLNFEDPRSKLFFEFVRLLRELKPRFFLLENVKMKQEYIDIISDELGVKPVPMNSSLVSGQTRLRLYWTNIPFNIPINKHIHYHDILDDLNYRNIGSVRGRYVNESGQRLPAGSKTLQVMEVVNKLKTNCITTVQKNNVLTNKPVGNYVLPNRKSYRYLTIAEMCRLQNLPDDYFNGVISKSQSVKCIGNGWTIDIITSILRGIK